MPQDSKAPVDNCQCETCNRARAKAVDARGASQRPEVGSTDWLEPLREEIRRSDKALHKMWDRKEEPDKCRQASSELNGLQLAFKLLTSGSNIGDQAAAPGAERGQNQKGN